MRRIVLVLTLTLSPLALAQSDLETGTTLPCIPRSMIPSHLQYAGTLDLSQALAPELRALQGDSLSAVKLKLDFGGSHVPLTLVFRDSSGRVIYKIPVAADVRALPIRGLLTKDSEKHPERIEVYTAPQKTALSLNIQLAIERTKSGAQNYYGVKGLKSKPSQDESVAQTSTLAIPVSTSVIAPQPCPEKSAVPAEPNCATCETPDLKSIEATDSLIRPQSEKVAEQKSEEIQVVEPLKKEKDVGEETLAEHQIQLRDFGVKANLAYNKNQKKCPKTPTELARWLGLKTANDLLVVLSNASKAYRNKEYINDSILKLAKDSKKSVAYIQLRGCQYFPKSGKIFPVFSLLDMNGGLGDWGLLDWRFGIDEKNIGTTQLPNPKNPGVWESIFNEGSIYSSWRKGGKVSDRVTIPVADGVLLVLEVRDQEIISLGFTFLKDATQFPRKKKRST